MKITLLTLAIAAGLTLALATQAQQITGDTYLDPGTVGSPYNGWTGATATQTPTGIEVVDPTSAGYGGAYFPILPSRQQTLNQNDTELQLTVTVNGDATPYVWFSPGQLVLVDHSGTYYYNMPYNGYQNAGNPANAVWNGNTVTITLPIQPLQESAIQAGGDAVIAFNLDLDPAVINTATGSFDVTYNSVWLLPVPEPTTVSLVGLGAVLLGWFSLRRRQNH